LAFTIERKRKDYYAARENNKKDMEITAWLSPIMWHCRAIKKAPTIDDRRGS
jgi:hypothetical protein